MAGYRIIKIEKTDGRGETEVLYEIQEKFLFFWVSYRFLCKYYEHDDWNTDNGPKKGALLINRSYTFKDIDRATKLLDKINNPYRERYKGNKLLRVFNDRDLRDVFINKSHWRVWNRSFCYEFSDSLDRLKEMIDKRRIKTKKTAL